MWVKNVPEFGKVYSDFSYNVVIVLQVRSFTVVLNKGRCHWILFPGTIKNTAIAGNSLQGNIYVK